MISAQCSGVLDPKRNARACSTYTGVLAAYHQEDLPFVPHVTLGSFTEDTHRCSQALEEAEQMELGYRCVVDRLHLVKINNDRSLVIWSKEFLL